jgi:L-histidine Nalpha-methyltransferase
MAVVAPEGRLVIREAQPTVPEATFAAEVRAGLAAQPKRLPCRYFYDAAGSRLFEQICELPEYYLTRAEQEILTRHADEIAAAVPAGAVLVELGSGSAAKTRRLIEAFLRRQATLRYVPIDISQGTLEESARRLLADYPALEIHGLAAEYRDGLRRLRRLRRADAERRPRLFQWLGSNVGNFGRPEAAAFLAQVRETMAAADRLLVGFDLRKDRAVLEPAYDDARGVTREFNLNLLARINRELGADFDLAGFEHLARYSRTLGCVEIFLVSRRDQRVRLAGEVFHFSEGERIQTERSYKYDLDAFAAWVPRTGLAVRQVWTDERRYFAVLYLTVETPART